MKSANWFPAMLASALFGGVVVYLATSVSEPSTAKLEQAMQMIERQYLDPVDRTKLIDGAIDGMLRSLEDPYTTYMDPQEAKSFYDNINATFEGIGATMEEVDGRIVIVAPLKGSPAEAAGLLPGDQVIEANGQSLEGMKVHDAVTLIRGEKGTTAELVILRNGREVRLSIVRDTIPLETVYAEMKDDAIGVIRIASFAESTSREYEAAVRSLLDEGMRGLVLDLRQNPGGITDSAQYVAETIIPDGEIVVRFRRRDTPAEIIRAARKEIGLQNVPVVAIIDGGSASAAEIVAGALQQSAGVPLVGEKTFGKGTAQLTHPFRDGSSMKYTVAEWLTPDGSSINKTGLSPDIPVALPEYAGLPVIDAEEELKPGAFSEHIRTVQSMLQALGFDPGREDGYFDEATVQAVVRFQESAALEPTGIISDETTKALRAKLRELLANNDTQMAKAMEVIKDRKKD